MFTDSALLAESEKLKRFSYRLTRNKADAEDLFQATCLRALEKDHYFEDGTNLFGWVSKIMFNLFVTEYRRKVKFESQYSPDLYIDRQTTEPTQDLDLELANIRIAMSKLYPKFREIIIIVCIKGMSYSEASEILHIPVGTVRSRLSRARKALQFLIDAPRPIPAIAVMPAYIAADAMRRAV